MGGNAIKGATRLEKKFYDHVADGAQTVFRNAFPEARVDVIPSYRSKESFGDLDILISGVEVGTLREFCTKALGSKDIVTTGNVISFGLELTALLMRYEIFQVDLIVMKEEDYNFALKYFSFNDLGNLIGQTAHGVGLKFGHDGLWYKYIVDTKLVKEICITKNFNVALELLGYDPKGFDNGFSNLEDIFEYVITSLLFTTWNYQLENRNATGRVRDKKRKTYTDFLEWLKDKNLPSERQDKIYGIKTASITLSYVALDFVETTLDYFRVEKIKKRFNGVNVTNWTGLTGEELGRFIAAYRNLDKETFFRQIEGMTDSQLEADVKDFYKEWSES